ncbi:hypothetical protein LPY66_11915 [Dehalobacter sp. DCM]|uniref:hypothetical protein n=1 Tax=Dehalobacter sp. DCM TaxID=2907827 RepID=UPI003081F667|nr:hypothetical protein LPY66_11915 [Dehalobacter sp. DCM]
MKLVYAKTDFPDGRSSILMRNQAASSSELCHYVLYLTSKGKLWIDVFWPFDEESEKHTTRISEEKFWHTFRQWRLKGIELGSNEKIAQILAQQHLSKKKNGQKI